MPKERARARETVVKTSIITCHSATAQHAQSVNMLQRSINAAVTPQRWRAAKLQVLCEENAKVQLALKVIRKKSRSIWDRKVLCVQHSVWVHEFIIRSAKQVMHSK